MLAMQQLVKDMALTQVTPWTTLKRELVADCKVFTVHCQTSFRVEGDTHDFYVFEPRNWVNVIAVTEDLDVIMVEQFRHGVKALTLEIPGGMVDAEDENTLVAANRELLEETGYGGGVTSYLGQNHPNPAIQTNVCDTYLMVGAKRLSTPCFDTNEEAALRVVPLKKIPALIMDGTISHALVIAAFYYLQNLAMTDERYRHLSLW